MNDIISTYICIYLNEANCIFFQFFAEKNHDAKNMQLIIYIYKNSNAGKKRYISVKSYWKLESKPAIISCLSANKTAAGRPINLKTKWNLQEICKKT